LTSVTPASSAPVLQTPKATSSTLYFDSLTVNAGNGGFLHCIQMDTSVNAANQVVSVGADIAFDADPRSEERRVGKERKCGRCPQIEIKNEQLSEGEACRKRRGVGHENRWSAA